MVEQNLPSYKINTSQYIAIATPSNLFAWCGDFKY